MPAAIRTSAALLVLAGAPTASAAQLAAWLDGSGTRIAYSGVPGASALVLSPTVQLIRPLGWLFATGSYAEVAGEWSLQGVASGSLFSRSALGVQLEGGGSAGASTHADGTSTNAILGRLRVHWSGPRAGVWTGGQLGTASNSVRRQATRAAEAGAWLRTGGFTAVLSATPTWIGDSLRFVEGDVTARLVRGSIELTASGGIRHWGRPAGTGADVRAVGSATLWLSPHLALVGGGGSYLADYAQGFPGGSYVTLGVRLATRRPAESEAASRILGRVPRDAEPGVSTAFEVRTERGDRRVIRVRAPGATRVELMGEFTAWVPVALRQSGAGPEWTVTLSIPPGVYRMNIRVDGGAWGVPPGVPALTDELGPVAVVRIGE